MRAQLPVGGGARQRTELAAGPPGTATPAAALGPGGRLTAAQLSLARDLQRLGEAGALPDVCGEQRLGRWWGGNVPRGSPSPVASGGIESLHKGSQTSLTRLCVLRLQSLKLLSPRGLTALSGLGLGPGQKLQTQRWERYPGAAGAGQLPEGRTDGQGAVRRLGTILGEARSGGILDRWGTEQKGDIQGHEGSGENRGGTQWTRVSGSAQQPPACPVGAPAPGPTSGSSQEVEGTGGGAWPHSPWHTVRAGLGSKPSSQSQRKLPAVLTQRPLAQRLGWMRHSSSSEAGVMRQAGGEARAPEPASPTARRAPPGLMSARLRPPALSFLLCGGPHTPEAPSYLCSPLRSRAGAACPGGRRRRRCR